MMVKRVVLGVGLGLYLLFVALMTLGPQPVDDSDDSALRAVLQFFASSPFTAWIDYGLVEFVANIAMFVPIGILLVALGGIRFWWQAMVISVLCTIGIETAQLGLPDRVSDVRDLIANTLGAAIGVGIVVLTHRLRMPARAAE